MCSEELCTNLVIIIINNHDGFIVYMENLDENI